MLQNVKRHLRLWVQVLFTALTNGYLLGFTKGKIYRGPSKQVCVPGLNCYSCPGAVGSCPIGSLQAVVGGKDFRFSFYVIGFLMIVGSLMGRFVCGWLCPFGLVQDLLHKIPVPKLRRVPGDRALRYLKYVVLAVFVFGMPLVVRGSSGYASPWFCKLICPSGTLLGGVPLVAMNPALQEAIGFLFSWKMGLLAALLILSLVIYRPFCKYLCPLGAIYGLFNRFSLFRYTLDTDKCVDCGKCRQVCHMGVDVCKTPNSAECIRCGKCISACPTGAIHTTFSEIKRPQEEKTSP